MPGDVTLPDSCAGGFRHRPEYLKKKFVLDTELLLCTRVRIADGRYYASFRCGYERNVHQCTSRVQPTRDETASKRDECVGERQPGYVGYDAGHRQKLNISHTTVSRACGRPAHQRGHPGPGSGRRRGDGLSRQRGGARSSSKRMCSIALVVPTCSIRSMQESSQASTR